MFSLEVYCRTAKLQVDGLVRSYGTQRLRIYRMRPSSARPSSRSDHSAPRTIVVGGVGALRAALLRAGALLGGLDDARYAWARVEDAYAASPEYALVPRLPVVRAGRA